MGARKVPSKGRTQLVAIYVERVADIALSEFWASLMSQGGLRA